MIVLADSSPLVTLAIAQHFELLREFYGEVIVSGEVHNEIVVAGAGLPGDEELRRSSWIRVASAPPSLGGRDVRVVCFERRNRRGST